MKTSIEHLVELIGKVKAAQEDLKNAVDAVAGEYPDSSKAEIKALAKIRYEDSLEEERQKANAIFDLYEEIFS